MRTLSRNAKTSRPARSFPQLPPRHGTRLSNDQGRPVARRKGAKGRGQRYCPRSGYGRCAPSVAAARRCAWRLSHLAKSPCATPLQHLRRSPHRLRSGHQETPIASSPKEPAPTIATRIIQTRAEKFFGTRPRAYDLAVGQGQACPVRTAAKSIAEGNPANPLCRDGRARRLWPRQLRGRTGRPGPGGYREKRFRRFQPRRGRSFGDLFEGLFGGLRAAATAAAAAALRQYTTAAPAQTGGRYPVPGWRCLSSRPPPDATSASPLADGKAINLKLPRRGRGRHDDAAQGQGPFRRRRPGRTGSSWSRSVTHPFFQRDGDNIRMDLADSPSTRRCGGAKVKCPTVDGPVMLTIKPGTSGGTVLRLAGKGWTRKAGGKDCRWQTGPRRTSWQPSKSSCRPIWRRWRNGSKAGVDYCSPAGEVRPLGRAGPDFAMRAAPPPPLGQRGDACPHLAGGPAGRDRQPSTTGSSTRATWLYLSMLAIFPFFNTSARRCSN